MSSDTCDNCGEELDGFSGCACALEHGTTRRVMPTATPTGKTYTTTMRAMVTRKLERRAAKILSDPG